MIEKNKLKRIFRKAIASGLASVCFAGSAAAAPPDPSELACPLAPTVAPTVSAAKSFLCDAENHRPGKGVPLTAGEILLVRGIFGKAVNLASERKYFLGSGHNYDTPAVACPDDGKNIEFWGTGLRSVDYSKSDIDNFGIFIHEITHVWQYQTPDIPQNYMHCGIYKYTLDSERHFSTYYDEQQAAIIEDYARHFLHPQHGDAYRYSGENTPESYALLAKVVEDQFPEAKKTRRALEAKEKMAQRASMVSSMR